MEIKKFLKYFMRDFDRIILMVMVLVLGIFFIRYINILRQHPKVFEIKTLYDIAGVPLRVKRKVPDENIFKDFIDKKVNYILGTRPIIFYKRLIRRNPFILLKELVVEPFSVKPRTLRIGVGEKFLFQPLNGIGPYKWKVEPENLGVFEGDEFIAKNVGTGKIIVTDARGHIASTERIDVVASLKGIFVPAEESAFIYRGIMKLVTLEGEEILAIIEEMSSGKTYFKKVGEEIDGFLVKDINQERLILFDKSKGKEMELSCE